MTNLTDEQLRAMAAATRDVEADNDALRARVEQLEQERIGYVKSINDHRKENLALRAQLVAKHPRFQEYWDQIESLRARVEQLEAALRRAEDYVEVSYAPGGTDWREGVLHEIEHALAQPAESEDSGARELPAGRVNPDRRAEKGTRAQDVRDAADRLREFASVIANNHVEALDIDLLIDDWERLAAAQREQRGAAPGAAQASGEWVIEYEGGRHRRIIKAANSHEAVEAFYADSGDDLWRFYPRDKKQ